ncbi:MAG TPA: hypothetical protein VFJ77_05975 [Gaiellaceae bacterium]|nr:hypothetical protein [Gaiellaceae bacterium]
MNEALFRDVNERIGQLTQRFGTKHGETIEVVCECADPSCTAQLEIELQRYEAVRLEPSLFVVFPGHVAEDVEDVVDRGDGYEVVRKHPGLPAEIARETDPRS